MIYSLFLHTFIITVYQHVSNLISSVLPPAHATQNVLKQIPGVILEWGFWEGGNDSAGIGGLV